MSLTRGVHLRCDVYGCGAHLWVEVTTTSGGPHQARAKAARRGWSWSEGAGDHCPVHSPYGVT